MSSQFWDSTRPLRLDYRRFTVVEGGALLPLGSTCRRKRLRSEGEDGEDGEEVKEVRRCSSRPNPEGSLKRYEQKEEEEQEEEQEELQRLCQRCHIMTSQLNRQAAALTDATATKDLAYASFLFDKLQCPRQGRHVSVDACCDVCGASFHQLRRRALRRALRISRETKHRPANPGPPLQSGSSGPSGPCRPSGPSACSGSSRPSGPRRPSGPSTCPASGELLVKQHRWSYEEQQGGGAPWRWGGVQSTYLGGGGVKGLATVTPLPLNSQQHLEGVWRVTCCTPEHQLTTGLTSDGGHVTLKPAAHSVATQTSQPASAAAAFFIRAAQKLSRRRKSHPDPAAPPVEAPGPALYTGGFSGALQLSPPAVPPCLLRAGSKVKDAPGMGKVRVMVRISSVHSSESSESMSLFKVDGRKKLLTLCEASGGQTSGTHKRSASSSPKTFAFDAIFSQDASQAEVCSGTVAEVIQSVVNGADGCIFCFGPANLGKTYTMIGRDCSAQSLGVAPTAIWWLFKVMEERRQKSGACFSIRASAVEISGREEALCDLLADLASSSVGGQQGAPGPAVSLREDPLCGSQLQNQTELQATNAERAAFFLDAALAARTSNRAPSDQEARRNSHFLFTLHLIQERVDKSNKAAVSGHSRLHLLDLGSCEADISRTKEGGGGQCLSLSALGNVLLALANSAKHVPYRDSKLTMLLSESLGNINCRTTMIAHISDSPTDYMETLTTVQLASRIHRMRKKRSKYASSSSGGESSCEEGPPHRPPHLRPLHPKIVALDPDTPLLLCNDPDYSSSSEHSCDTVIYVGPGGASISDRELSDNEGPPSFVPIIPSLNRKKVEDGPRRDRDHLKCNTFAELQQRLDCIDGSEGPTTIRTETGFRSQAGDTKPTEATSPPKSEKTSCNRFSESTLTICTNRPDQEQFKFPSGGGAVDTSKRTGADGEKLSAPFQPCLIKTSGSFPQDPDPVVREKVYLRGVPKPSASPSLPRTFRAPSQPGEGIGRTPSVGMNQQPLRQPLGSPNMERARSLQAALLGSGLDSNFLRTTVTLQRPVELNGEDELVFTVVEDLPLGLIPDNGCPSDFLSFGSSLQALASASRPVSIISSINDEYDAYTCRQGAVGPGASVDCQEVVFSQHGDKQTPREVSADSSESEGTCSTGRLENASLPISPIILHKQPFLQHGIKSSLNDSGVCFSELDSDPATPNKTSFTKCPPFPNSTKASLKVRASTLDTSGSHHTTHSSLPKKNKPTSSVFVGCSRLEDRQEDFLLQGSSQFDPREVGILSVGKPPSGSSSISSKRPGGNSNSAPHPPKAQMPSSDQRVVDGCEKSSSRRGDTLMKLPRLTRGATTLGTISGPQTSESRLGHEGTSGTGTRFSSLDKRSNGQKSAVISRSRSGNISPPLPPVRQSREELKTRTIQSPRALKTSCDVGRFPFPKASEEEFIIRVRAESFCHRKTSLKADHGSTKTSSLKTRGAKAGSSRYFGGLMSLDRCQTGSKSELSRDSIGATLGGNSRSSRSVPRLGYPTSTSAFPTQVTTSKLDPIKGSSRAAVSTGSKIRSLSTSSSKSPSSSPRPVDKVASCTANRSGVGTKTGRRNIMGTKQAVSRAANSRVSELATSNQRRQLSSGPGFTGSDGTDSRTSVSGQPTDTLLPSPYSKITEPRHPQRYSSGHASDNSSILSGELPPAMGHTALFYHSGGSSGYESMIRDSETTGSTSSAHDSMSESGVSSANRGRVSKSPKKRGNGFLRRRLIPVALPDPRRMGGQWVELGGAMKEPFEIKVYEIDEVELLQRRREEEQEEETGSEMFHDVEKGLVYLNAQLKMLEKRQQQIRELRVKHESLKEELEETKTRLMLDPRKWTGDFEVDQNLDRESQDYLEALAQATEDLQSCVNLCKSRVMMETCFDITATAVASAVQEQTGS